MEIREKLILAGVKNLKDFGYEHVDEENILTDEVYSMFFVNMLNENKGYSDSIDVVIEYLLTEINKNQ